MRQRPPPRRASRPERSDAELRSIAGFSTGSSSFRARKRAVQRGRRTCCRVLLEPRFTESFRVGSRIPTAIRSRSSSTCDPVGDPGDATSRVASPRLRLPPPRHEPGAKVTYVLEHRSHRPVVGVGHVAREHGVARSDDLVEPEQPVRVDGLRPLRAYSSASATSAAARSFSTTVYPSRSATTRSTSGYT
jgi:hypothetical protein